MEYALVNNGVVQNVIVADEEFIASIESQWEHIERIDTPEEQGLGVGIGWLWNAQDGFSPPPAPPSPPMPETWIITRNALQNRFPITANGVSTKYDLATLFLNDAGYAAELGVTGAQLYDLRALLITGNNRLGVVSDVDLKAQATIDYVNMMTNTAFPEVFRLTASEAAAILDTPAGDNEKP